VSEDLVELECVAEAHAPSGDGPDKLTIHEGRWAFCPYNVHADGHVWRETGGADLSVLLGRARLALRPIAPAVRGRAVKTRTHRRA
jgi:hypothetical protein